MGGLDGPLERLGALADPVRRQLYRFVASQAEPVSREQAAQAVGIARHQAKFHLDRLESEGLLDTDYVRLTGRTGPGAGRPAKRYRRGSGELSVTLPPRTYDLAAHIMADAIADHQTTGTPLASALEEAATTHGAAAATGVPATASASEAVDQVWRLLAEQGYEPRWQDTTLVLANCPFHRLAQSQTALVCGLNLSFVGSLVRSVAGEDLDVRLDPGPDRCCVVLGRRADGTRPADATA